MRKTRRGPANRTATSTKRDLAPPELRYQYLRAGPGRSPWALRGIAGGIGITTAVALAFATDLRVLLGTAPILAAVAGAALRGVAKLLGPSKEFRAAPVAIVPWGIVLDPDGEAIALPWPRLREVSFTRVDREGNRQTEAAAITIMLFNTDVGVVQAQAEDGEWVSSVDAFAPQFARSWGRGPAADLAGKEALDTTGLPSALALLRRAEAMLDSADGRAALGIESGSYRTMSSRAAGPETKKILRDALWSDGQTHDPGPLAAVLIAELGISDLLPDLLRLILSTSPLLAAASRSAAQKLGASPAHAGSLDELAEFLPAPDLGELRRWTESAPKAAHGLAQRG